MKGRGIAYADERPYGRDFAPVGVRGALYRPGFSSPVPVDVAGVAFDDPRVRWVRAGQLVMRLRAFTVVGLEAPRTVGR
ncbi:hypothetical protein AB0O07_27180 [Streptomyces sp. NPDC093085]|uniref:hypothetical protein n=1 Tax=Streptomyces sp. NPDC093085 TaxID=3155068 RepID=UPI003418D09D